MRIHRLDEETIALEDLDAFCCHLLSQIATHADPSGNRAAEERLYSSPTHGAEPQTDEEWKEYVEPDLRQLFMDAVGVVTSDLQGFPPPGHAEPFELTLPVKNLEAWIHALNQARLALSARHDFTEREMEREISFEGDPRGLALFQIHFYGLLQEFFLRQLD